MTIHAPDLVKLCSLLLIDNATQPFYWSLAQWKLVCGYFRYDDVIKWKHFPRYWPFVRGIHRSPVNSLHKGQWRGALMFSLICVWINGWINNRKAGDLRCYRAHYDVTVMNHHRFEKCWRHRISGANTYHVWCVQSRFCRFAVGEVRRINWFRKFAPQKAIWYPTVHVHEKLSSSYCIH